MKILLFIGNLTNKKVKLSLPRFEFDFSTELSQIFKSFGIILKKASFLPKLGSMSSL